MEAEPHAPQREVLAYCGFNFVLSVSESELTPNTIYLSSSHDCL